MARAVSERDEGAATAEPPRPPQRSELGRQLKYILFFAAAVAVAMMLSRRSSGPTEGVAAKDFTLPNAQTGESFRLSAQRGTPVLVEVFASWCGVCRQTAPTLEEVSQAKRARAVRFVGVSVDDSAARAQAVKRAWGIPYDVLHDDGSFAKSYDITLLPTFILVDDSGHVRRVATGGQSKAELERWLDEVGATRL